MDLKDRIERNKAKLNGIQERLNFLEMEKGELLQEALRIGGEQRLLIELTNGKKSRERRVTCEDTPLEDKPPYKVFERDKWTCQLCGVKTPKEYRGTPRDDAPMIDHIIPYSLGGSHAEINLQCVCRKCKQAKGAKVEG